MRCIQERQSDLTSLSLKSQFKKADKSNARVALILGEDEIREGTVTIKYLRENQSQQTLSFDELLKTFKHQRGEKSVEVGNC